MKRLKPKTLDQLRKTAVPLSAFEERSFIGGCTDLGGGLVALNFSEMLTIYGNPSAFPSYAYDGPNQGSNLLTDDPNNFASYPISDTSCDCGCNGSCSCGCSCNSPYDPGTNHYSDVYGASCSDLYSKIFVVPKSDLGHYASVWLPPSSDTSSESQDEKSDQEASSKIAINAILSQVSDSIRQYVPWMPEDRISAYINDLSKAIEAYGIANCNNIMPRFSSIDNVYRASVIDANTERVIWSEDFYN